MQVFPRRNAVQYFLAGASEPCGLVDGYAQWKGVYASCLVDFIIVTKGGLFCKADGARGKIAEPWESKTPPEAKAKEAKKPRAEKRPGQTVDISEEKR